jgi:hypothetical protein
LGDGDGDGDGEGEQACGQGQRAGAVAQRREQVHRLQRAAARRSTQPAATTSSRANCWTRGKLEDAEHPEDVCRALQALVAELGLGERGEKVCSVPMIAVPSQPPRLRARCAQIPEIAPRKDRFGGDRQSRRCHRLLPSRSSASALTRAALSHCARSRRHRWCSRHLRMGRPAAARTADQPAAGSSRRCGSDCPLRWF